MTRRPPSVVALAIVVTLFVIGTALVAQGTRLQRAAFGGDAGMADPSTTPRPTVRPIPGHEVYGYVPYWEMVDGIADHVARTELTTVALFSVTHRKNGTLDTGQVGYRRTTGGIGERLIREAHDRGARVELVYTSFGLAKNARLFGGPQRTQDKVISDLVALVAELDVDGINVDVEQLEADLVPAFGGFVERLRTALRAQTKGAQVSVATAANTRGAEMAAAAADAGADRIVLMGYDYHWSGSTPGASAPMDRRDGDHRDLVWSLDLYEALGVPVDRTLLGLPLYGMAWPAISGDLGAPQMGRGEAWIPSDQRALLGDPSFVATRDDVEQVEFYAIPTERLDPQGGTTPGDPGGWLAIYVDSPATLTPKLALADERGLAGAGFWAIGYERGLPEYTELIARFRAGELD
jgi:hypothetical protein